VNYAEILPSNIPRRTGELKIADSEISRRRRLASAVPFPGDDGILQTQSFYP